MSKPFDVCVIGGAGHVGAPLAVVLANNSFHTMICDTNTDALNTLRRGIFPFIEEGGESALRCALEKEMLEFSSDISCIQQIPVVILTIGTPINEYQNPVFSLLTRVIDSMLPYLSDEQTIILRSTVAPGVTEFLGRYLSNRGKKTRIAFCPERVVQGKAIEEIQALPQLVSGITPDAIEVAANLFRRIAPEVVEATTREAEYAKLICNAFRYIQFAATNQLYMMVESAGLDYNNLLKKMKIGYPRMQSIPGPGFAAGPCLMKDTMQLFSFVKHSYILGQVAVSINEGLPNYIVERLASKHDLTTKKIGILGMAFKAESDDIRDSLSYKLGKILRFSGATVLYSDEYVADSTFVSKEDLVSTADIVVIGVPHKAYRLLEFPASVEVFDMWGILETE